MLNTLLWNTLTPEQQKKILKRPELSRNTDLTTKIKGVIESIRTEGDCACIRLTSQFDNVTLTELKVTNWELDEAYKKIDNTILQVMKKVITQLEKFHLPQKLSDYQVETAPGVMCESLARPLQRVGLYIPGGSAPLVSTTLMLGVPSQIAGCPLRILCSPPDKNGNIHPAILVAAQLCGITEIYKLGGAQAIAAMAYSTESIPQVDKIFGPGNRFVTEAKIQVALDAKGAQIDSVAGPSEVMVIADQYANPEYIAADLLSQAEHGVDSQVMLVSTDIKLIEKVNQAVERQICLLSRKEIAEAALKNSCCIYTKEISDAITIANQYAPEHLIMQVENPRQYTDEIFNAGSVFLGAYSPESAGDYASGPNHVLPTDGFAKSMSALTVKDFMKTISVQELTRDGLAGIADCIRVLADLEGMDAHRNAVEVRSLPRMGKTFLTNLVRPEILAMRAYSSARKENNAGKIWLDANEKDRKSVV